MPSSLIFAATLFHHGHFFRLCIEGAIGSFCFRFFTSSIQPNGPVFRKSPMEGCFCFSFSTCSSMYLPIARAFSISRLLRTLSSSVSNAAATTYGMRRVGSNPMALPRRRISPRSFHSPANNKGRYPQVSPFHRDHIGNNTVVLESNHWPVLQIAHDFIHDHRYAVLR